MLAPFKKLNIQNTIGPLRSLLFFLLFFLLCFLYLWLIVEPHLIYHGGRVIDNFPIFFMGWDFFLRHTTYPGGIVEYIAAFLTQLFYISWLGAAVITILAWLTSIVLDSILKNLNAQQIRFIRFVPPILIFTTYARYTLHFTTFLAFLVAILFTSMYLKITDKSKKPHIIVFVTLFVILYYIAAAASLLFAALCAIHELLFNRRIAAAGCMLCALVIPYVIGTLLFSISAVEAFSDLLPVSQKVLSYETRSRMVEAVFALYLLVPVTFVLLGLWRLAQKPKTTGKKSKEKMQWLARNHLLKWSFESALLLAITTAAIFAFHDKKLKATLMADYYLYNRMWPQVLETFNQNPNSFLLVHAVNQALFHTGQLSSQMFAYPQNPDTLFLTSKKQVAAYWKRSYVYFDLGAVNFAEGMLTEAVIKYSQRPMILKRLALTNMAKGNLGAAGVFLSCLEKTPFHRKWARQYLQKIEADLSFSNDPLIRQIRDTAIEENIAYTKYNPEQLLLDLLRKNRKNKMAFEYLMAWYLVTVQLDKFVQHLHRLEDFDYSGIPRHYEEAILIYQDLNAKTVTIRGRAIRKETLDRANKFANICNRYRGPGEENTIKAMYATTPDFIDTYFFYFNFGHLRMLK